MNCLPFHDDHQAVTVGSVNGCAALRYAVGEQLLRFLERCSVTSSLPLRQYRWDVGIAPPSYFAGDSVRSIKGTLIRSAERA